MGAKTLTAFLPSPGVAAKALSVGGLLAALSACISDGPNKTGGDYLSRNGILLENPLYHVRISGFPLDRFWSTESGSSHYGDTILLAGRSGNFSAEPRMAYEIDTTFLDSLAAGDSALKLSVGFPKPRVGLEELKATLEGDTGAGIPPRADIAFEVRSWTVNDSGIEAAAWTDSLRTRNRMFLLRQDTLAVLPEPSAIDTVSLKVATAYAGDSLQAVALPRLRGRLLLSGDYKHLVHLHLTPLPAGAGDSGSAMLRLGGNLGEIFSPILLFGEVSSTVGATAANRLLPKLDQSRRQINYRLSYAGSPYDMLATPNPRGLHISLDRTRLLDSIQAALTRGGITPPAPNLSGDFDLTYFVPFASISLPLADSSRLEGGFPVQIRLISSVDTLLDETDGSFQTTLIPLDATRPVFHTFDPGNRQTTLDTVSVGYHEVDGQPGLRRVTLRFSTDSLRNDTIYLPVGETRQWTSTLIGYAGGSSLPLTLGAGDAELSLTSHLNLNTRAITEANEFRDPATGETIQDIASRIRRFLHPGQESLELRATRGIQLLLNRTASGREILPEFQFLPVLAIDSTAVSGTGQSPEEVPYPVLSVVSPAIESGRLTVDLDIYLYPLKKR